MLNGQSILAIIPARSGSRGLPDKNVLPLGGKPMLAHTVAAARDCGVFDAVVLSTDSEAYAKIGRDAGAEVPFLRQPATATDTAGSWDVVREVLAGLARLGRDYRIVVLLQPTSPLRTSVDILGALALFTERKATVVVSVCEVDHPPEWTGTLGPDGALEHFRPAVEEGARRQDFPASYRLNGAIYVATAAHVAASGGLFVHGSYAYVMPRARSIDVDTMDDFTCAEALMLSRGALP